MRFASLRSRLTAFRARVDGKGPQTLVASAAVLSVVLIASSLLGPGGVRRLQLLRADLQRQEASNAALRAQLVELERVAKALGNPPDAKALEKAAREQLGYIRADELLFKFE